ncbi:Integrator complex subunit 12, partial [Operophtera brumata]
MSSIDFDPSIKLCLKYLHSGASDSTEQLRLTLDEHIRQAYGSSKTLGNVLPKKYLNEEKMESARSKHKIEKSKTVPVSQPSPQQIQIPERDDDDGLVMDGELAFDLLEEDLTCTDCHKPVISDSEMSGWNCASCLTTQGFTSGFSSKVSSSSKSPSHVSGSTSPVKISSSSSASSSPSK